MLIFHRNLKTPDYVALGTTYLHDIFLHHVEGSNVTITTTDHQLVFFKKRLPLSLSLFFSGFLSLILNSYISLKLWGKVLFVVKGLLEQMSLIFRKSLLNPSQYFAPDDAALDTHPSKM